MDKLEEFILLCKSRGFPFSVRRDGSWERLSRELSKTAMSYIQKIPDPGFFVPVTHDHNAIEYVNDGRRNIILQIALDAYSHRFGGEEDHEENMENFTRIIQGYASSIIRDLGANIIFAVHTLADTIALVHLFSDISNEVVRFNFRATSLGHPLNASAFYKTYAASDLVVGMRGHSVICGTGLGIPTIAISTHDKIAGFMDEIGCNTECLYPITGDFEELLYAKTTELLQNPQRQRDTVAKNTMYWRREFANFMHECLEQV
jgi:polysaccharide pyruvyl transferase WcaK-like protein